MISNKIVYIVHCVDTEGPLYESLSSKFERIKDTYNINIKPTSKNLKNLKLKKIPLNGKEQDIAKLLSDHLTNYNDNWFKINKMLKIIFSKNFRKIDKDSFNRNWIFNWHCLDHVGYRKNPRRREIGYHKIFDHYNKVLKNYKGHSDKIHWHFHPMSTYKEAHRCATSYVNSPELYQILCRRIIERKWFPAVYRAGFQTERPDSNLFLEQWIPFDISNMSTKDTSDIDNNLDFKLGRSGDWRRATKSWTIYHPSHDDYQSKGNCRRWIGRALNVMNRIGSINQKEMDNAFREAKHNGIAMVGIASHDFRNLETEVNFLRKLVKNSSKKFPEIKFKYSEGKKAFLEMVKHKENLKYISNSLRLGISFKKKSKADFPNITVKTLNGQVFGPQPFLAIQTKSKRFIHDNFDFSSKKGVWHYAFQPDTLPLKDVLNIGVAANDKFGNTFVKRFKIKNSKKAIFY